MKTPIKRARSHTLKSFSTAYNTNANDGAADRHAPILSVGHAAARSVAGAVVVVVDRRELRRHNVACPAEDVEGAALAGAHALDGAPAPG